MLRQFFLSICHVRELRQNCSTDPCSWFYLERRLHSSNDTLLLSGSLPKIKGISVRTFVPERVSSGTLNYSVTHSPQTLDFVVLRLCLIVRPEILSTECDLISLNSRLHLQHSTFTVTASHRLTQTMSSNSP